MYTIYKSSILNPSKPAERTLTLVYDNIMSEHRDWNWINDSDTYNDIPTYVLDNCINNPVLKMAVNSAGSMEFESTPENDDTEFKRMTDVIIVRKQDAINKTDRIIWEGRILKDTTDFWNNKKYYCEGVLSSLNDTRQPQHLYKNLTLRQFIEGIISVHNQKADPTKRFNIGIVTAKDNPVIDAISTNFESTWEIIKKLVDEYKGYLSVRYDENDNRFIDFRKECGRTSTQTIEFGENLLDFTKTYDMSSLATVVLPLGKKMANAGQSTIGEKIDAKVSAGYYIDEEDYSIKYDYDLVSAYFGSSEFVPVQAEKTFYISARSHDGRLMYVLKDSSGNVVDYKAATNSEGMTDIVEYKITVPKSDAGNSYYIAVAGFGYDIYPRINASIDAPEDFDKYTTVESVNNNSMYITNQDSLSKYGWIEKQITWDKIEDPSKLKDMAEKYLKDGQFDEMTLKVSAIDLQLAGANVDSINFLDEVRVLSKFHGMDKVFPLTEMTIDMDNLEKNKFTLGFKTEQTLTGTVSSSNDDILSKINSLPSQSSTLKSAKDNATRLINNATSGIFQLEYAETGNTTGFRISNVPNWNTDGAKGWRFNMGGIAYYGNGFNNPITMALTGEDGGIVANSITTGVMSATRIKGGTLGLGHWKMEDGNYIDGSLQIADKNGNLIVNMDQNGAHINGNVTSKGESGGEVNIIDGWIKGSDTSAGRISMDTTFGTERGGGHGVSIDTPILAFLVTDTLMTGRSSDASDLTSVVEDTEDVMLQGAPGWKVWISVKNGLITRLESVYEPDPEPENKDTTN